MRNEAVEPRYYVEPDPAWDLSEIRDGTLTMELSWMPDALAGRMEEIVASPQLVTALKQAGVSGFTTSLAHGYFTENSIDVEVEVEPAPRLQQLHLGNDETADLYYAHAVGLIASPRAVEVLRTHCTNITIQPQPATTDD
jgi:hypothetical protein